MKRQEIEAVSQYPFSDFRKNDTDFALLYLYWPSVVAEAIGPELSALIVPLSEPDQDRAGFGTPTLMSFWIPQIGRGIRLLYNDPADPESDGPRSRLFASVSLSQCPPFWELPTGGQVDRPVHCMEELVFIADTHPDVADAVAATIRHFLVERVSLADMQARCTSLEARWLQR